jgi:Bifunctional DNA primase/polymerase, N-terminal
MTPEFTFPCWASNKAPCLKEWQRSTFQWMTWKRAELVGAHTDARNGFAVLDVDIRNGGMAWYDANFDALPQTFAQASPGGLHLYFRHAPGLKCSTSRIAPGVDIRAEGGYVILWAREGLPFEEHPLCEMPDWLREEAFAACGPRRKRVDPREQKRRCDEVVHVSKKDAEAYLEALRRMDPVDWRGDFGSWFALLTASKAVGIGRDDFVEWSIGDPEYVERRGEIERIWECARAEHGRALWKALAERGIKITAKRFCSRGSTSPRPTPTISLRSRTDGLRAWLAAEPTDDRLFTVAATFGEIILEKRIKRWVANDLLEGACQANGLWKSLGADRCKLTIANAFRHVEEKFLGERE